MEETNLLNNWKVPISSIVALLFLAWEAHSTAPISQPQEVTVVEGGEDLWPQETMMVANDFPFLVHFSAAHGLDNESRKSAPVVVLIPGANSLARIFYGGPDQSESDFLTYWLNELGHHVIAISYPLVTEAEIFDKAYPNFTTQAWGSGAALITRSIMADADLSGNVIGAVWSMGGKSVQPFSEMADKLGLKHELHIALASTPPLYNSSRMGRPIVMHETGTILRRPGAPRALRELAALATYNEREVPIIPSDQLARDYTGHTPAQITGRGLRYREDTDEIVRDVWADMQDTRFYAINFPLVGTVIPSWPADARHVLTDHATWGYFNSNTIFHNYLGGSEGAGSLTKHQIKQAQALARQASEKLRVDVEGNHFFFVGRKGAQATAQAIQSLRSSASELKASFNAILSPSATKHRD